MIGWGWADIEGCTLRQIVWARQGREFGQWEQLSHLLSLIANVNRDPKKKRMPFTPHDFFRRPGAKRIPRGTPLTGRDLKAMKPLFTKGR